MKKPPTEVQLSFFSTFVGSFFDKNLRGGTPSARSGDKIVTNQI